MSGCGHLCFKRRSSREKRTVTSNNKNNNSNITIIIIIIIIIAPSHPTPQFPLFSRKLKRGIYCGNFSFKLIGLKW